MQIKTVIGFAPALALTVCQPPALTERPVLDALQAPVNVLGACVARRQWDCTTTATRDVVAIMDAADGA
jgi:hypothetical protein